MKEEIDFDNNQNDPLRNLKSNQLIHKEVFLDMNAPISPGRDGQLSPGALSLSGKPTYFSSQCLFSYLLL